MAPGEYLRERTLQWMETADMEQEGPKSGGDKNARENQGEVEAFSSASGEQQRISRGQWNCLWEDHTLL